jgi:O-antigen/teichoic acid export membrane protein
LTRKSSALNGLFIALASGGGLALFVASCVSNGSNFLFNAIMSRILGPATYGALGSLLGIVTVATFALVALQATVTQRVAERRGSGTEGRMALRRHMSTAGLVAAASLLVVTAFSPVIEHFLHLTSPVPVAMVGLFVALTVLTVVPQGVLLGQLRFRVVAVALVGAALVRLGTGIILTQLGFGLDGAIAASVASAFVLLIVVSWPLHHELWTSEGDRCAIRFSSAALAVGALGGFAALVGVDSFLARHYLSPGSSGEYVAAATAARIALFLPSAIALIAFPKFAATRGVGEEARHVLKASLLAVGGLGALAAGVTLLAPHVVISILFGARYQQAAGALRILSVSAVGLGLISVLVYFHLARRSLQSLLCWLGVALASVSISFWHERSETVAWSMLLVTGVTFAFLGAGAIAHRTARVRVPLKGPLLRGDVADLDLSIVVPYFNAGTRVRKTVEDSIDVLRSLGIDFEIIAVSDGSNDGSDESLSGLPPEVFRSIRLPSNQGKGEALRAGLALGRGTYLGFIDADGDIPVSELAPFVALVHSHSPDIVVGSKRHSMSEVVYPPVRRIYSWGYQLLVRVLFRLKVRDTQTGIKLIRREVLADVLPRMLEKRFAFDLELLVVAHRLGYRRVFEAPVHIGKRFSSTISVHAVWKIFTDTLAIFYRLRVLHYYDIAPVPDTQPLIIPVEPAISEIELVKAAL